MSERNQLYRDKDKKVKNYLEEVSQSAFGKDEEKEEKEGESLWSKIKKKVGTGRYAADEATDFSKRMRKNRGR